MKLLLAERDPVWRGVIEATLSRAGYSVLTATDGRQAFAQLTRDDAPSFALLDWQMPGLDGLEICQQLRHRHQRRELYVILLVTKMRGDEIVRILEAGMDDYVTKPFSPHELLGRLRVGQRFLGAQGELADLRHRLAQSHQQIRQLQSQSSQCP